MTRRVPTLVVVAALLAAAVATPLAVAGVQQQGTTTDSPANASDAPGARLAGVLGSRGAGLSGDLQQRSLDVALERADTSGAKAAVVARSAGAIDERLAALNATKATLRERYENGSITAAEYRARLARFAAQSDGLQTLADRSANAARDLPDAALREHGVDVDALQRLRRAAGNLTGPEIAAIARNVTGGPPADAGPPGGVPGASDSNGSGRADTNTTGPGAPDAGNGGGDDDVPANATDDSGADDAATNRTASERTARGRGR